MGFFDTVKDKAGALAADTQRAGKVTAAQARLVVLQNDLRRAERELGHAAFVLAERGELDHAELAHAVEGCARRRLRCTPRRPRSRPCGARRPALLQRQETAARAGDRGRAGGRGRSPGAAVTPAATTVETAAGPVTVASFGGHGGRRRGG